MNTTKMVSAALKCLTGRLGGACLRHEGKVVLPERHHQMGLVSLLVSIERLSSLYKLLTLSTKRFIYSHIYINMLSESSE